MIRSSLALVALASLVSCGGAGTLDARLASVESAMFTLGLVHAMPVSRVALGKGEEVTLPIDLQRGGCVTFVALGEGSARDLDLSVRDSEGEALAEEKTLGAHASVRICPAETGHYGVRVAAVGGAARVLVAGYREEGGAGLHSAAAVDSSCDEATMIRPGERVTGDTARGASRLDPSCGQGGGPERVYTFELTEPARAAVSLESTFDAILSLRTGCEDGAELACNDDYGDPRRSRVEANLAPGVYYVVVDGFPGAMGEFSLALELSEIKTEAEVCASAEPLIPGQAARADNRDGSYAFMATCANGASGPEHVRRLAIDEKSRVRVIQQSDFDGVLHLRSECARGTSELACNDDYDGVNRSLVTAVLDPGEYYVISDSFGGDRPSYGTYSVKAEAGPAAGAGMDADSCAIPGAVSLGEPLRTDTFHAVDDLRGSCGGAGAPDTVHRVALDRRTRLRVSTTHAQFDGVVYVLEGCEGGTELMCERFPMASKPSARGDFRAVLDRGVYHVVVDGQRPDAFGLVQLDFDATDVAALERTCRTAPILSPGRMVAGSTSGRDDAFRASCAGGAKSGDAVYRIQLRRRSHVEISLSASFDSALHLRRSCLDDAEEIACNDDHGDNRHSKIEATLEPGTYFVVVDGFRVGNEGSYELVHSVREL